jgi:hypothetical protein
MDRNPLVPSARFHPARRNRRPFSFMLFALVFAVVLALPYARALERTDLERKEELEALERILVFDGSAIHNVGNLQVYVGNWGSFGSRPNSRFPTADFPSAQWPAGSGVEYLYIAGLWVGAKLNGIPVVSTSAFDYGEFMPTNLEVDRIYESYEGAIGGMRLPGLPDDDRDGLDDEDWLNGHDDDGDGKIDEDYAAISKQMFSCWYTDDDPKTVRLSPEHTPLGLWVKQESYQWDKDRFDDFVGVQYWITNYGSNFLEDVYVGFMADGDVGPRIYEDIATDDGTGLWQGIVCPRRGNVEVPIRISVAYFYDVDSDGGMAPGYFGIVFLGHDTDPLGDDAPRTIGLTSYQNFAGELPYENGGDPTNDFQRYELMSKGGVDRNGEVPRDYRMLMAVGPFSSMPPDCTMVLQVALVCGYGLEGMKANAGYAALTYQGNWFNVDGNPKTGVGGCETPVFGPAQGIVLDSCVPDSKIESPERGQIAWINADCREELALFNDYHCAKGNATLFDFMTGVDGKETQIHWLVGSAPPAPKMRIIPGDNKVTLIWDNLSEVTPDVSTLEFDFEGYRIWRADGLDRPFGTTMTSGPNKELWQLLEERDLVNGVSPDVDFKVPYSEGGWQYEPLLGMENKDAIIEMFEQSIYYAPLDHVPCPPGLTDEECDTLEALARYNMGFEGGFQYYKYVDEKVHNGMHYFYSVTCFDHMIVDGVPVAPENYGDPSTNFQYTTPVSDAQPAYGYDVNEVYVVPNPATAETMEPWRLEPNQDDPTGVKVEFRNLPACPSTVRIFTIAGDLVEVLYNDGSDGTLAWDLVSRNGQDVASGIYLFSVEPENGGFPSSIGKFIVIR